jgi:hypothetical protein
MSRTTERWRGQALIATDEARFPLDKWQARITKRVLRYLIIDADDSGYVVASYREIGTACKLSAPTIKRLIRRLQREFEIVSIVSYTAMSNSHFEMGWLWWKSHAWHRAKCNAFHVNVDRLLMFAPADVHRIPID